MERASNQRAPRAKPLCAEPPKKISNFHLLCKYHSLSLFYLYELSHKLLNTFGKLKWFIVCRCCCRWAHIECVPTRSISSYTEH